MLGRVKRKAVLAGRREPDATLPVICALCERPLGKRIEWHHPVPRSEGGRETVPLHPICHRIIHATFDNATLAREGSDLSVLRMHPELARFLAWVAAKPPDFHAPTRRR
jgi:hypothetical protein